MHACQYLNQRVSKKNKRIKQFHKSIQDRVFTTVYRLQKSAWRNAWLLHQQISIFTTFQNFIQNFWKKRFLLQIFLFKFTQTLYLLSCQNLLSMIKNFYRCSLNEQSSDRWHSYISSVFKKFQTNKYNFLRWL